MTLKLDTIHFNNILNRSKVYETRIYDEKRQKIKLLDELTFKEVGTERTFKAIVIELSYSETFREAIEPVGIKKVLPNVRSLKDGISLYENIKHGEGGLYKDAAKKYGVLRMKFKLL